MYYKGKGGNVIVYRILHYRKPINKLYYYKLYFYSYKKL